MTWFAYKIKLKRVDIAPRPLTNGLCFDILLPTMKSFKTFLQVAAVLAVALAFLPGNAKAASSFTTHVPAAHGELEATASVPAGASRVRVSVVGTGATLEGRPQTDLRVTANDHDHVELSTLVEGAPLTEEVLVRLPLRRTTHGTTTLVWEVEGGPSAGDGTRDPWVDASGVYGRPVNETTHRTGTGQYGGLAIRVVKPLGSVDAVFETEFGQENGGSQYWGLGGSDSMTARVGFGVGQHQRYGARWRAMLGGDAGQLGMGASRPAYAKLAVDQTALPGQPWEAQATALIQGGSSGGTLGASAGGDIHFLSWNGGVLTLGLRFQGRQDLWGGTSGTVDAGPVAGVNVRLWSHTLRVRVGATLGKAEGGTATAPLVELSLHRGN